MCNKIELCRYLDHAVLKPEITIKEAAQAIELGVKYNVKSVCVRPSDIELAKDICAGTNTNVITVLAFPHGCVPFKEKTCTADMYIQQGVSEIDMVSNYGYIRSHEWELVRNDFLSVTEIAKKAGILTKIILETNVLTFEEIAKSTQLAADAGADFVKTSTGFNGVGATIEAVNAMLEAAAGRIRVKASGGIRDAEKALMFINLGVGRLGVNFTSTTTICDGSELIDHSFMRDY